MVSFENLTAIDRALVTALVSLGGVASEPDLERTASNNGENGSHGTHAHFAKNLRALVDKEILVTVVVGRKQWCFTDEAWAKLGTSGPAPRPQQEGLF